MKNNLLDSLRPYTDSEAVEALQRISEVSELELFTKFLFPTAQTVQLREAIRACKSVADFQTNIMSEVVDSIVKKTTSELSVGGKENIFDNQVHLIMSNHRDIALDPAILQLILIRGGYPTSEITVGDNLFASQFIEDLFRLNRMIKVIRGGSIKERYEANELLSTYIRNTIESKRSSIWIAQKSGRTKDGLDSTEIRVLKMFEMSGNGNFVEGFTNLNILPLSISYEYEPCDFLKCREIYISRRENYVKKIGEDINSIITGAIQSKGKVHYQFGKALSKEQIEACNYSEKNAAYKALSQLIDSQIRSNYKLFETNYIAYDLLHPELNKYANFYTAQQKEAFIQYTQKGLKSLIAKEKDFTLEFEELQDIFLNIYANPVKSKEV